MNRKLKLTSALLFAAMLGGSLLLFMQVLPKSENSPSSARLFSTNIAPSLVRWVDDNSLIISKEQELLRFDVDSRNMVTLCTFESSILDVSIRNPDEFYVATADPSAFNIHACSKQRERYTLFSLLRTDSSNIVLGNKHVCLYSISEIASSEEIATTIRMISLGEEPSDLTFSTPLTLTPILCGTPLIASAPFPLVPSLYTWASPEVVPKKTTITDPESISKIVVNELITGIQQEHTVALTDTNPNSQNSIFTLENTKDLWSIINDHTVAIFSQDNNTITIKNPEREQIYPLPIPGVTFNSLLANPKGTAFSLIDTEGTLWILQTE